MPTNTFQVFAQKNSFQKITEEQAPRQIRAAEASASACANKHLEGAPQMSCIISINAYMYICIICFDKFQYVSIILFIIYVYIYMIYIYMIYII